MVEAASAERRAPPFLVVGIGSSAGGIPALRALFSAIRDKPSLAFVVVQHLMPNQPSELAKLIGRWTALPVCEAAEGMKLERGCVFVAPPGQALGLSEGVFTTEPHDGAGARAGIDTIDRLFEALAADCGEGAIAVVLSGTGADGAAGAVRVKQAGGMVLVQEPASAAHEGMPRAAIASGAADQVLPLAALARELVACASPDYVRSEAAAAWADDVTKALDGIIDLVGKRAGFDLSGYKTTPLLWRIQRRMELRHVPLFGDYEALLHDDTAELEALVRGIPIHVTEFFRDAAAWERLEQDVIPRVFEEAGDAAIRAWTPACATGEEAYSLAMLLSERAAASEKSEGFQVFATDVAPEIVARAGRGIFKPAAVNALSAERRQRFFYAADQGFRVKRALREKMVFAPHDLLADPPFTSLDVITCRNLLIYLEPDAGQRVIYLLHSALRTGGYLFLGQGESLAPKQRGFEEVASRARIYRKVGPAPEVRVAFPRRPLRLRTPRSTESTIEAHAHEAAVEARELPAVLVDERFQIVRLYGDIAPFLHFKAGEPSLNLLSFMGTALGLSVERAAREALSEGRAVEVGVQHDVATGELAFGMRVTPLDTPEEGGTRLLVSFVGRAPVADGSSAGRNAPSPGAPGAGATVDWSEALRLSHEELEASREELQALNEELRAANDQLNLANDDLATVNNQLRGKIQELETQSNVLSSGAVMTLFVDQELRVQWFTPAMKELFPLRPGDAGRPITEIAQRFDDDSFIDDVRAVMQKGGPREAEVQNREGKWFLRRIFPHIVNAGARSGAAITFADVSERRRAEEVLRESEERQAFLLELSDALRPLTDPVEMQRIAMKLLAELLDVMRACYFEADYDQDWVTLTARFERAPAPIPERLSFSEFAPGIAEACRSGRLVIFRDTEREAPGSEGDIYRVLDIRAWVAIPLVKEGRFLAALAVHSSAPRDWTSAEVQLAIEVAERTWAAVELARLQRHTEELNAFLVRFSDTVRGLGDAREVAEAACRLAVEKLGVERSYWTEIDWTRREYVVGPTFQLPGVPGVLGRFPMEAWEPLTSSQLAGNPVVLNDTQADERLTAAVKEHYANSAIGADLATPVTASGQLRCILTVNQRLPRQWTAEEVALVQGVAGRCWAEVERARAEAALRESEERHAFLLRLADTLRQLQDPREIQSTATRLLRDRYDAGWCLYVEWDETAVGVTSVEAVREGLRPVEAHDLWLMPEFIDRLRSGEVLDLSSSGSEALDPALRARFGALGWEALLAAPLLKEGRLLAALLLAHPEERRWPQRAVVSIQLVAERTGIAVARARAQADLRESEARFRALAETSPVGVGVSSTEGTLIYVNRAYEKLLGYEPGALIGQSASIVYYNPDERAEWLALLEREGSAFDHIVRLRRKDGTLLWVSSNLAPVEFGGKRAFIGVIQDVTERRRAEAALRESEQRLRATQENAGVGIHEIDAEGRYLHMNETFTRLSGYTLADFAGRTIFDAIEDPRDRQAARASYERLVRGEIDQYDEERRYVTRAGRRAWVEVRTTAVRDERGQFLYAVRALHDTTVRRGAEEALRESEERLRLAMEVARLASWDWDLATGAVKWNDAHYRMMGYQLGEVTPGYDTWIARVHPDDRDQTIAALNQARERRAVYVHEFRTLHPDGKVSWISARGSFFLDDRGEPYRMIGIMEEVTTLEDTPAAAASDAASNG